MGHETLLKGIARRVDISAVRTDVELIELKRIAAAAIHYQFICAFAMPCFTPYLIDLLKDEPNIMVGGAVGFPSGADTTAVKVACARDLMEMGVNELDMVINVGALKSGLNSVVEDDIRAVIAAANGLPVKSILEICYLTDEEIMRGSEIAAKAGVTYIKTGTGWGNKPTTVETISLIKRAVGDSVRIKAAGGIRTLDTMLAMIDAGCDRFGIGLGSIVRIMKEVDARLGREDNFSLETCLAGK